MSLTDQQLTIIVGGVVTIVTTIAGMILRRGQKDAVREVHAVGQQAAIATEAAAVSAVKANEVATKVDQVHAIVNGSSQAKDVRIEHKRLENRLLYGYIQKLRDQLLQAGMTPVVSEIRVGPLEEQKP